MKICKGVFIWTKIPFLQEIKIVWETVMKANLALMFVKMLHSAVVPL